MSRRAIPALVAGLVTFLVWLQAAPQASAQYYPAPAPPYQNLSKFYYYPYYYFPHNYWPQMGPKWPEAPGQKPLPPPAWMAYPPFREPHWRYEWYQPQNYYRGFHFWLDQF